MSSQINLHQPKRRREERSDIKMCVGNIAERNHFDTICRAVIQPVCNGLCQVIVNILKFQQNKTSIHLIFHKNLLYCFSFLIDPISATFELRY